MGGQVVWPENPRVEREQSVLRTAQSFMDSMHLPSWVCANSFISAFVFFISSQISSLALQQSRHESLLFCGGDCWRCLRVVSATLAVRCDSSLRGDLDRGLFRLPSPISRSLVQGKWNKQYKQLFERNGCPSIHHREYQNK